MNFSKSTTTKLMPYGTKAKPINSKHLSFIEKKASQINYCLNCTRTKCSGECREWKK